jgi:hypothetical protein
MTEQEFHKAADALIEAFEFGDITYEEFDMAYEELMEQTGDVE